MKTLFLYAAVAILFFACNNVGNYQIKGVFVQQNEGTVYLQQRIEKDFVTIDSCKIIDGKFLFKGKAAVVEEYYLSLANQDKAVFFLENTGINVQVDSLLKDAVIEGGKVQTLFNVYNKKYKSLYNFMLSEYYKSREIEDDNEKAAKEAYVDSLYEDIEKYQENFMRENAASPVAVYILSRIQYGKNFQELNKLFLLLDNSLEDMKNYKILARRIEELKLLAVGQKAPDYTQNDVNGDPVTLSNVYHSNKITMVDFWASWCGPCRAENPKVVAAFEKFGARGFTVLGVSLDKDKERWLKAIEDDKLQWLHVSDLKGWDNGFSKTYLVNSIPANFLINNEGIIVAVNLGGDDLIAKLDELLTQ